MDPCPHCGQRHEYIVELKPAPLLFGSSPDSQKPGDGADQIQIAVSCPATGKPVQTNLDVRGNEEFVRVITLAHSASAQLNESRPAGPSQPDVESRPAETAVPADDDLDEYSEWVKSSRDTGVDFGKTMLTASSGAVAVYFAVLQYLGSSKAPKSPGGLLSALPPVLFLAAAAVFALALRPRLSAVARRHFQSFRDDRLRQLNRLLVTGTGLFIVALAVALGVYINVMKLI